MDQLSMNLSEVIGRGTFGTIYSYLDKYAVKVAKTTKAGDQLEEEVDILEKCKGEGIPTVYSMATHLGNQCVVMELLGESLQSKFNQAHKSFEYSTVARIGLQMIDRLEHIHNCGIVHRDLKPSNICVGLEDESKLYLIDFGLSVKLSKDCFGYQNKRKSRGFEGNFFFSAAESQLDNTISKKSDYESLTYIMLLFLKQDLPWGDLCNEGAKNNELIARMKNDEAIEKLCEGLPEEFREFVFYIRNLESNYSPNCQFLKNLLLKSLGKGSSKTSLPKFEWESISPSLKPKKRSKKSHHSKTPLTSPPAQSPAKTTSGSSPKHFTYKKRQKKLTSKILDQGLIPEGLFECL
ncbi:unnamed protein product [Moneuplotes crassus]|uniref:Casein kinase I n=1 Tax=Euplotes crassus TaxID=5936 RepID=A0AAD1XHZ7_EUPCR|nr:unnamed protein product [Moneuplotes crassus]